MPLPIFALAIPVLHSSGAWIASTAASGYIAGTLSSSWIGAFVLGNSSLLGSVGLVSAAGIFGASSGLAALSSTAVAGIGTGLTAIGLGGVANALGIAPVATFLGLTPIGWAIIGTAGTIVSTLGYYFTSKTMQRINEEREKGNLEPTTLVKIFKEVQLLERRSLEAILAQLAEEMENVTFSRENGKFTVDEQVFAINRLKYVVNNDGSEEIVFVSRMGRKRRIVLVKPAAEPEN
ncbi:MAG: hypothetical protein PHI97_14950 [Desulfobulbus sp.]|nr:hypothetical protein [Desulfobulbus sp.]